jgi:hypothetical protein
VIQAPQPIVATDSIPTLAASSIPAVSASSLPVFEAPSYPGLVVSQQAAPTVMQYMPAPGPSMQASGVPTAMAPQILPSSMQGVFVEPQPAAAVRYVSAAPVGINMMPVMLQPASPTISVTYTHKEPVPSPEPSPTTEPHDEQVNKVQEQVEDAKSEEVTYPRAPVCCR